MSDLKQVKVDNWGIYFLQRLKHFFNRTDYCDLTLQFQDNAQLKVHRLVLSACTEYFELLERTCEMYEDCLVMPDDLQADVVVPIINFMYTGQLEFKVELLDKLLQTSQIMNMPVLTNLLDAQRQQCIVQRPKPSHSYSAAKRYLNSNVDTVRKTSQGNASLATKRSYSKAMSTPDFVDHNVPRKVLRDSTVYATQGTSGTDSYLIKQKAALKEPRPTRYELPEELDTENIFEESFSNISYTSKPLLIHPESTKTSLSSRNSSYGTPSSSRKHGWSSDVECKKISKGEIFEDDLCENSQDSPELFDSSIIPLKREQENHDKNKLFDQILENNTHVPKFKIESKNKQNANLDHAKIISEVLKKYPHLVKGNKNIKLKILDTQKPPQKTKVNAKALQSSFNEKAVKPERTDDNTPDYTYETDVLDYKEAAKLISMGAENVKGPWICLICGTPGQALHFTSYYKFRRHLVEVHHEKAIPNMCEYCGLKSFKRNNMLHHLYTKHGVPPPQQYHFPRCNECSYIALTEGLLVKHKLQHNSELKSFRCNVCASLFSSSSMLLQHIQVTGHKFCGDRKTNHKCVYCQRVFVREGNLYAHLKTNHRVEAKRDRIIEFSDDESQQIKYEVEELTQDETESEDMDVDQKPVIVNPKKDMINLSTRQKILNTGFQLQSHKAKVLNISHEGGINEQENVVNEDIIVIDNNEYIMRNNQLILKKPQHSEQYSIQEELDTEADLQQVEMTSMEFATMESLNNDSSKYILKKTPNQPIQIVVSNEEEYKALMSSNHPIIFDQGSSNKPLSVLTDNSQLDIDTNQANEMMVLPEEYQLNVSEAVQSDNQNIVVVYTHPVHNQNKQYQLLTTQGTQFDPSSAVITQAFAPITTSSQTTVSQLVDTIPPDVISNELDNSVQQISQKNLTVTDEHQIEQSISETELPEIDLMPVVNKEKNIESTEVIPPSTSSTFPKEVTNIIDQSEVEDHAPDTIALEEVDVMPPVTEEICSNMDMVVQSEEIIVNNAPVATQDTVEVTVEIPVTIDQQVIQTEITENVSATNDASEICVPTITASNIDIETDIANGQQVVSSDIIVPEEKIKSLTSEWSEDEEEMQPLNTDTSVENEVINKENSNTIELEESIENIQQEVDKQNNKDISNLIHATVSHSEKNIESVEEKNKLPINETEETAVLSEVAEPNTNNQCVQSDAPLEKISSLLNDWDENDSQDLNQNKHVENVLVNEDVFEDASVTNNEVIQNDSVQQEDQQSQTDKADEVIIQAQTIVDNKDNDPKTNKIKSLVSDWEDEEEQKEML